MGQIIRPGSSVGGTTWQGRRSFFLFQVIRQYGFRGFVAMLAAAFVAFVPLAVLIWFNVWRVSSVVSTQCRQSIVVKSGRLQQDSEKDEPGETGLLRITCEVPTTDGWQELLRDEDPYKSRPDSGSTSSIYVRRECVYLRKISDWNLPFGMLGRPPVSVWLPAGEYQIAVVHHAPQDRSLMYSPVYCFPLVTVMETCQVTNREKTVRRISLPHYDWGNGEPIKVADLPEEHLKPIKPDVTRLCREIENVTVFPSPGGYLMSLPEPRLQHLDEHRGCTTSFEELEAVPREWSRDQLAELRRWLPYDEIAARQRLRDLISNLQSREMLEGWFSYLMAGIAGCVFTKWGTISILEPWRRKEAYAKTVKLCIWIFVISAVCWYFWTH